ncbi:MAG: HlyU family transcriptional regulator [Pseudomonadota bacterium]
MSILKKLFGGGLSAPAPASIEHEGYTITPAPVQEATGYRIGAKIEKAGQTHDLIRADTVSDLETATEVSIAKAKQVIDQQGDGIFR